MDDFIGDYGALLVNKEKSEGFIYSFVIGAFNLEVFGSQG